MDIYLIIYQRKQIEFYLLLLVTRNVVLRGILRLHFISLSTLEVLWVNKMASIFTFLITTEYF